MRFITANLLVGTASSILLLLLVDVREPLLLLPPFSTASLLLEDLNLSLFVFASFTCESSNEFWADVRNTSLLSVLHARLRSLSKLLPDTFDNKLFSRCVCLLGDWSWTGSSLFVATKTRTEFSCLCGKWILKRTPLSAPAHTTPMISMERAIQQILSPQKTWVSLEENAWAAKYASCLGGYEEFFVMQKRLQAKDYVLVGIRRGGVLDFPIIWGCALILGGFWHRNFERNVLGLGSNILLEIMWLLRFGMKNNFLIFLCTCRKQNPYSRIGCENPTYIQVQGGYSGTFRIGVLTLHFQV